MQRIRYGSLPREYERRGGFVMLKDFAWDTFINSGILESYIFYREIEERDRAAEQRELAEAEAAPSAGNA